MEKVWNISGRSDERLSRLDSFAIAIDLDQGVRRYQEEPPRLVHWTGARLGRDGRVPGNDPELGDLFFEIIGKLPGGREDFRREHDPGERDRDLRNDGDVEDPLRPLSASWTMPRALAIGIASASARCGRGPRVMGGASF